MKPRVYLIILLLIIPFQASLLDPVSIAGIRPDLALAVVYIIGLLTSPREAAFAGIVVGLLQDIPSVGFFGITGLTRGLIGLSAGLLGRRVLNIASMSNIAFLAAMSLMEAVIIAVFIQILYGSVPFFSMLVSRMLPQALYTGLLGTLMLRLINKHKRTMIAMLTRRTLQREL